MAVYEDKHRKGERMKIKTLLKIDTILFFTVSLILGLSKAKSCMEMSMKQFVFVMAEMIAIAIYAIIHAQAAEACDE